MEIVDFILAGFSNRVIGEKLGISERTVEGHALHIYYKVGVKNRVEFTNLMHNFNLLLNN